jgi:hypothetical protein
VFTGEDDESPGKTGRSWPREGDSDGEKRWPSLWGWEINNLGGDDFFLVEMGSGRQL